MGLAEELTPTVDANSWMAQTKSQSHGPERAMPYYLPDAQYRDVRGYQPGTVAVGPGEATVDIDPLRCDAEGEECLPLRGEILLVGGHPGVVGQWNWFLPTLPARLLRVQPSGQHKEFVTETS